MSGLRFLTSNHPFAHSQARLAEGDGALEALAPLLVVVVQRSHASSTSTESQQAVCRRFSCSHCAAWPRCCSTACSARSFTKADACNVLALNVLSADRDTVCIAVGMLADIGDAAVGHALLLEALRALAELTTMALTAVLSGLTELE